MELKIKKYLSAFIVFVISFMTFMQPISVLGEESAVDTTATKITQEYIGKNKDGIPVKEIKAGEDFVYNVNLSISGNGSVLYNHVVRLELDNEQF